jgi:hypothetical protein
MKKAYFIIIFLFISNGIFSQRTARDRAYRELETLIQLDRMMENDEINKIKAQKIIFGTRDYVQNEIRKNHYILDKDDYDYLISFEKIYWENILGLLKQYGNRYENFVNREYDLILKYKRIVLSKLNEKIPEKISCENLLNYVKNNSETFRTLSSDQLNSSWLKNISLSKSENNNYYVIASMKDKNSFKTEEYIYCNITSEIWNNFLEKGRKSSESFGELFWEIIQPKKCDCR